MPDVSGVAALDVLIGLFFVYLVLSIVVSTINEFVAMLAKWRANDLENGLRNLLGDEEALRKFQANWRIRALNDRKGRAPSYISPRAFSLAVLDTFAPPAEGPSEDVLAHATKMASEIKKTNPVVGGMLADAIAESRGDVDRFRHSIERTFDDVMDRVSGWYKRRVQWFMLGIGLALACFINADSFAIGERLWKDDAVRAAVVAEATEATKQDSPSKCADVDAPADEPLDFTAECVDEIEELGIPLGWTDDTIPDDGVGWLGKIAGLLLTACALSFGAPFWFDLLGKVARLRGAGGREPPVSMDDKPQPQNVVASPNVPEAPATGSGTPQT